MKYLTLLFILFVNPVNSQTKGYLPLDVGNEWHFNNSGHRINVISEQTINGTVYQKIYRPAPQFETLYVRYHSDKVYIYSPTNSQESLLYDFTVPAGTTFYTLGNYFRKCTINDTITYLGKKTRVWRFESGSSCIDCQFGEDIIDNVGWQWLFGQNYSFVLSKAIIKGNNIFLRVNNVPSIDKNSSDLTIYPNPFNPSTTIKYSLNNDQIVNISIYNVLGLNIVTLFNGMAKRGENSIFLKNEHLASGVYFIRLLTEQSSITKKIQVLR